MASSFIGNTKASQGSENVVASIRVFKFVFNTELEVITAEVQALMRDNCYKVQVRGSPVITHNALIIRRTVLCSLSVLTTCRTMQIDSGFSVSLSVLTTTLRPVRAPGL